MAKTTPKKTTKTISDIKAAVNRFRGDTTWIQTRTRWDADFDLYRLKAYDAGAGYFAYTTNAPRNLANKAISMLTEAKILIRIPEETLTDDMRDKASNIERLLYGVINANNERLMKIPDMPPMYNQMCWHSVLRGGYALRVFVKKDPKTSETVPEVMVWDLYNTAYGIGADGLLWAAYTRKITKEQAQDEYEGIRVSGNEVEIIDYWDRENNAIVVGTQWGKEPEAHSLDYCPVYVFKAGDMPPVSSTYAYTGKHIGESIFAPNRGVYPIINKTISDLLTVVRRGVKVPIGIWSQGAERELSSDIWQVEKAASVQLDLQDKVEPLFEQTMPANYGDLLNLLTGDEQRGGISYVAQGQLGFRLSGFAINQLQSALDTLITPFSQCVERGLTMMSFSVLDQYSKGGFKPIAVRGKNSKGIAFGVPKPLEIKPEDIDPEWKPEIKIEPTLPRDDAQRYDMAVRATQGENPVLSMQTARDALLELPDTKLEENKVSREWAERLPTLRLYKAMEAALAAGRPDIAMNIVAELRKFNVTPPAQGGKMAPQTAGLESSTMPAETTMATPPGAQNATEPPPTGGI